MNTKKATLIATWLTMPMLVVTIACSKTTAKEPDPADKFIGTYTGTNTSDGVQKTITATIIKVDAKTIRLSSGEEGATEAHTFSVDENNISRSDEEKGISKTTYTGVLNGNKLTITGVVKYIDTSMSDDQFTQELIKK